MYAFDPYVRRHPSGFRSAEDSNAVRKWICLLPLCRHVAAVILHKGTSNAFKQREVISFIFCKFCWMFGLSNVGFLSVEIFIMRQSSSYCMYRCTNMS